MEYINYILICQEQAPIFQGCLRLILYVLTSEILYTETLFLQQVIPLFYIELGFTQTYNPARKKGFF